MKAYMGIFLVLLLTFCSAGILGGFLNVVNAQDMHADMVNELENSSFYPGVLADCFQKADRAGYDLSVTLYQEDYTLITCTDSDTIPADTSRVEMAKVELTFPLRMGFFEVEQAHTFCGYAR
jgi:hypothetical protein